MFLFWLGTGVAEGKSRFGQGLNREKDELHGTAAITEALRKRGFAGFYRIFARELEELPAIIYYKLLIINNLRQKRQMDQKRLAVETHSHYLIADPERGPDQGPR
ncbi:MAG: hypothetical protein VX633_04240 [Verrucomicrobiota bacterium]|nr:hypothetical protein [Verrucomicrobiota bacterium]